MKTTIKNQEVNISFPVITPIIEEDLTVEDMNYRLASLEKKVDAFMETFEQEFPSPYTVSCIISTGNQDTKEILSKAFAVCSRNDRYCRVVGEKLALARALKELNLIKSERRAVWKDYFPSNRGRRKYHKSLLSKDLDVQLQAH